ncbi:hypothetical protein [Cnuella takakiae]|nr:hypothetical protein [Cnuella takakiae]
MRPYYWQVNSIFIPPVINNTGFSALDKKLLELYIYESTSLRLCVFPAFHPIKYPRNRSFSHPQLFFASSLPSFQCNTMKKLHFIFTTLFLAVYPVVVQAQTWEIRAGLAPGLSYFGGNGAQKEAIYLYRISRLGFGNLAPFGSSPLPSLSGELQAQHLSPNQFIGGIGVSYESLRCRQTPKYLNGDLGWVTPVTGKIIIRNNFLTLNPHFGKRLNLGMIDLDPLMGMDVAFNVGVQEKTSFTSTNEEIVIEYKRHITDLRPRLQSTAQMGNLSVTIAYAHGLTDYLDLSADNGEKLNAYNRYLRAGLYYKIR